MKKKLISMFMMALCLTFVSCGNKSDRLLDEYEDLVEEAISLSKKTTDGDFSVLPKLMKLAEKAEKLQKKLEEADLTPEQKERFVEILAKEESMESGDEEEEQYSEDEDEDEDSSTDFDNMDVEDLEETMDAVSQSMENIEDATKAAKEMMDALGSMAKTVNDINKRNSR